MDRGERRSKDCREGPRPVPSPRWWVREGKGTRKGFTERTSVTTVVRDESQRSVGSEDGGRQDTLPNLLPL